MSINQVDINTLSDCEHSRCIQKINDMKQESETMHYSCEYKKEI